MSAITNIVNLAKAAGPLEFSRIVLARALKRKAPLHVKGFSISPTGSDPFVFAQVFGGKEYDVGSSRREAIRTLMAKIKSTGGRPVIIDGGGNVGYAAAYFATEYPEATIISVEPDPNTFEQLQSNCARYKNVLPIYGAIWVHNRGVHLGNVDMPAWARTVEEAGATPSFTLNDLISRVDGAVPVILKLDIEGAEAEALHHSADLVKDFPCVLIEPHDFMYPGRSTISGLFSTFAGRRIDTLLKGENLMFFDMSAIGVDNASK